MNDRRPALRFKTSVPLNILEDFLAKECSAKWDLKLEGIADDLNQKVVKIAFDNPNDVARFKTGYATLKAKYKN